MTLFVPLYKENSPKIRALAGFFLIGMFRRYFERIAFGKGADSLSDKNGRRAHRSVLTLRFLSTVRVSHAAFELKFQGAALQGRRFFNLGKNGRRASLRVSYAALELKKANTVRY